MNGIDQIRRRLGLEHVTLNAGAERLDNVVGFFVHGQENRSGARTLDADLSGGIDAVEQRHRDIEKRDVGVALASHIHGFAAVGSFGGNFESFLQKDSFQAVANDGVVIGNQYAMRQDRVSLRTEIKSLVPSPGAERISREPPIASMRSRMPTRPSPAPLSLCRCAIAAGSNPMPSS